MKRLFQFTVVGILVFSYLGLIPATGNAAGKLKFTTAVKFAPVYYLPMLAAEEKGFWKSNGLDAKWVPFTSGASMSQAVATGSVHMGFTLSTSEIKARAAGLPTIIVSGLLDSEGFFIWVRSDSRFRKPTDLQGAKIGVSRMGSGTHIYGRMISKRLGIDKQVKFVSTGGMRTAIAMLKTGAIDAGIYQLAQFIKLKINNELRELISVDDYLPKEWSGFVIFAHQGFLKDNPEIVRNAIKAIFQSTKFIRENPSWTIEKLKVTSRFPEQAAKLVYESKGLDFSTVGKIDRKALENVRDLLVEYGIVSEEKTPPVDKLYTTQFIQ